MAYGLEPLPHPGWRPPSGAAEDRNTTGEVVTTVLAVVAAALRGGRGSQLLATVRVEYGYT
ncbi:hypothetical protein [Streptomyces sp. rh34]|uniref:hypothetical protein n=1 Tax=Streptomyces sp. rh34 TaxID=2034272 RepID=UPI000BF11DDE|nr:hypothetical protein [Streptomyces sp. rh34]